MDPWKNIPHIFKDMFGEDEFFEARRLIKAVVDYRYHLRHLKKYKEADELRDLIVNSYDGGFVVEDDERGTIVLYRWEPIYRRPSLTSQEERRKNFGDVFEEYWPWLPDDIEVGSCECFNPNADYSTVPDHVKTFIYKKDLHEALATKGKKRRENV